jgi:hypothetical protein
MGSWLALITSTFIGGMILLSFNRFSSDISRDTYVQTLDQIAYEQMDELARLIDYDFSRIGFGINDPSQAILIQASATDLRFNIDSNGDGVLETMRYFLGDSTTAAFTSNPRDRMLFRVVNSGTPQGVSSGLTQFTIRYFDAAGNETANLNLIRTFEVNLTMESEIIYENQYPKMFWRGRFTPPSLVTS